MIACTIAEKKNSAIAAIIAIIWKPLSSDRSDRSDHMETGLKSLFFFLVLACKGEVTVSSRLCIVMIVTSLSESLAQAMITLDREDK